MIFAIIYFQFYLKYIKIVQALKHKTIPILAHWFYSPHYFPLFCEKLAEDRATYLSNTLLIGFLALLIVVDLMMTYPQWLLFLTLSAAFIIVFCILFCLLINFRYHHLLTHTVETIIGEEFIYFSGHLYGIHRGIYCLLDCKLVEFSKPYIELFYGYPGVEIRPLYSIKIPVPTNQIPLADAICAYYLKLIKA